MAAAFTVNDFSANMRQSPNVVSLLGQRRRRWTNIEMTLGECLVFAGISNHVVSVEFVRRVNSLNNLGVNLFCICQYSFLEVKRASIS